MASASKARALVAPLCAAAASRLLRRVATAGTLLEHSPAAPAGVARCFATRTSTYYLRGKILHCSDKSAKLPVLLNGRDFQHWLVVMEPPAGDPRNPNMPRAEIIKGYVDTLAQVVGSDEEAKKLIYSVSTRCYFAFGVSVSEELSCRLRELPNVKYVLPDSYLYPEQKDYGGEPFINGEAVPYDPKYHSEWLENDDYAKYVSKCNDIRHGCKFESSSSDSDFDSFLESAMNVKDDQLNIKSQDSAMPEDDLDLEKGSLNTSTLPEPISDGGRNVSEEQVSRAKSTAAYEVMTDGEADGDAEPDEDGNQMELEMEMENRMKMEMESRLEEEMEAESLAFKKKKMEAESKKNADETLTEEDKV